MKFLSKITWLIHLLGWILLIAEFVVCVWDWNTHHFHYSISYTTYLSVILLAFVMIVFTSNRN
jgi:hypothetical protein